MAKLQCEICGGSDLLKQGDVWVCQTCGSNYTAEDVKKMFQSAVAKENSEPLEKKAIVDVEEPTESVAKKDKKVTVAQVESEAVRVQMSDFTIVAGTLTEYKGSGLDVVIPEGVIEIGDECFKAMTNLRSVVLPNTLRVIGFCAFENCNSLTSVVLPSHLEEIGIAAFEGCSALKEIVLPDHLKQIDSLAFRDSGLISIKIPGTVNVIGDSAFFDCIGLTSIEVEKRVCAKDQPLFVKVDDKAFYGCKNVKTVIGNGAVIHDIIAGLKAKFLVESFSVVKQYEERSIPITLVVPEGTKEVIGPGTNPNYYMMPCNNLIGVKLPSTAESVKMFSNCKNLTEITIPNSVTRIEDGAFEACERLQFVQIPESLTYIGKEAFGGCDMLPADVKNKINAINPMALSQSKKGGCYVATCVYGDYNCPEVWTLRRYRDDTLGTTWYGRLFIRVYYAVSPIVVKLFGKTEWFRNFWRSRLDKMVKNLQDKGVENTPYEDKDWRK